jgi:hypothetical protein
MALPEMPKPNIARDLMLIHRIISRGMEITRQKGQEFIATGFPDEVTRQGYYDYVHCLVSILNAHHLTEEEVAFPQFGVRIPAAPYKLLVEDHQKMVAFLVEIQSCLDDLKTGASTQALSSMLSALERLITMWYPHIGIEESHFAEGAINPVMSPDEQKDLSAAASHHSQEHSSPDYLVVPFMLLNLSPAERRVFSAPMPPVVTQQLVPQVWKEKWLPMQPFLLAE